MHTNSRRESSKNTKALKSQQLEDIRWKDKNKIEEVFPWLLKFNKTIRSYAGSRSYQDLEQLLSFYTQNILSSITDSNVKLSDEINLKNHINKMLIFFHLYWLDIKQDIADHSRYLNKVSALLNIYIDMELKISEEKRTSSHIIDSSKIAAKIFAALYIYLNNSEEHIFRVLLRIKHATEKYRKICNHIFTKSFNILKTKMTSITDVAYIRYLLAFKMWKEMEDNKEEINKLALMLLGPHIPKLQDELRKFVPELPTGQENTTLWLMQSNELYMKREQFLLFEDKMDNSAGLQCTKTIIAEQNCSKSQKQQMNSLFHRNNSNEDTSEQKIKKYGLQNNNTLPNNKNKSLDKTYLQKKKSKSFKPLKRIFSFEKPGKPIEIIDLTRDDEKRKKTKRNSKCLKVKKNIMKSKKHINPSKYSDKLVNIDKECSNKVNKSLKEKIHLEYKPVYDMKISDNTQNSIPDSNKSSLNDVCHNVNVQENEHLDVTNNQINNTYLEFVKENEKQHDYNLKSPIFVDQNIKVTANVLIESKLENCISSYATIGNATNSYIYNNSVMQNKEALTSQKESAMETVPLFKTCQNYIADQHSFKQELPSTNCNAMQKSNKSYNTIPVNVHDMHFIIKNLKFLNDHNSQITEFINQKYQVNECPNCYYTKIDCKPFIFTNNDITVTKAQETLHNTSNDNENDIKLAIFNDRLHSSESGIFGINSFDISSNAEIEIQKYDLKSFPKIEEANEITKTDYVDLEYINSLNIQSETFPEDFFRQSSEQSQINYDNLTSVPTKKSFMYIDNDITTLKTQDTLHNMFNSDDNNVKTSHDIDIIYMLSDHDKCIYVTNNTDEHMTTNTEKRMQCLSNSNDMCTVSTFTGDQIVMSLDSQHVNSDNRRKYDYEDGLKYSENTMKQQRRNNCDTLTLNEQLHSSEFDTFDIDSSEIDSRKANEIMKTNCINDFETISFSHDIQIKDMEDMLSNDTTNDNFFLPLLN